MASRELYVVVVDGFGAAMGLSMEEGKTVMGEGNTTITVSTEPSEMLMG